MQDNTQKLKLKSKKNIVWIYKQHHSGDFWFVDVEWEEKWYFVHFRNRFTALDWDTVKAEVSLFRGKEEAKIREIVKRSEQIFSWVFLAGKSKNKKWANYWFVRTNTANITKDIFIPWKASKNAKNNDVVTVKIIEWESKNPEWKIIEVIGNANKKWILLESLIAESGFKKEYSLWTLEKLEKISPEISKEELRKRRDLRGIVTFTIDGEDAKDLDDAISLELAQNEKWDFYKLYVHIADVTHFVKDWSDIDKTALNKATSVYLADRVIPMLPKKLSNELCSLNTSSAKLSLTCEMHIALNGTVFYSETYESIIQSNYRFTYKEVDQILAGDLDDTSELFWGWKLNITMIKILEQCDKLKEILIASKSHKWMLEFDFPETRVLVKDYEVQKIYKYPKYESNEMIEQFMVLANESVAFQFKKYPFLYRVHEKPKEESVQKLQKTLENFDIDFKFYSSNSAEFLELLRKIKNHPKAEVIEKLILRTLTKAEYKDKNLWHFWLASKFYSHFTSPIRRYPDLQIHRIIKQHIHWKLNSEKIWYYKEYLSTVAKQSSQQEQKAEKLEYKVRDYYICQFYSSKIGETFSGKVSGMIPAGTFIELADTAEWFVELDKFIYSFDEETYSFYNKITEKQFSLWDDVKVILNAIDTQRLRLNFEIV